MSQKTKKRKNKAPGRRPPVKADPHKQKATLAQFATLAQEVQQSHQELAAKTNRAINELWRNQQEILQGMGAAEFNLRAHQKVLNSVALEIDALIKRLPLAEGIEVSASFLIRKEVEVDGQKSLKIDWPAYHKMVDEEIKAMKEAEKAAQEAALKAAEEAKKAKAEAPTPETPAVPESGTVEAKEDGDPTIPDGATVFGG